MKTETGIRRIAWMFALGIGIIASTHSAMAQDYPTKSITLLLCMRPGAGADLGGRMIAEEAQKILGKEIVPVNKPGGGGTVAAGILATSKADGYTLLACTNAPFTIAPHFESVPFDPLKDFTPILQFGSLISGIVVRSDSPHKSFKEFIDFARKNPGKLSYGFPGVGTGIQAVLDYVALEEKVDIATVPFEGAVPSLTALLGGHVSACGVSTSGFLPHLKAGKVRVLATTGDKRLDVVPDAPTLYELGYPFGIIIDEYAIVGPKGIPPAVVKTVEEAFLKAVETPRYRTFAENLHMYVPAPLHGKKYKEHFEELYAKYGEIFRKVKLAK